MKTALLPFDTVPVFVPTWDDIKSKAHFYATARLRSNGDYVAIRGVRDDVFAIVHKGELTTVSTADLCNFCL